MAIFVVLIFQVLFILFAMTINVALVVHDKINLQNSLDLAVYYGATKQAEVLNAMAHINYQMRQNWKLLAWRYRILGTMGQNNGIPSGSCSIGNTNRVVGRRPYWCPQDGGRCGINCNESNPRCNQARGFFQRRRIYPTDYCDNKYFVCISFDFWKRAIKRGMNICNVRRPPNHSGQGVDPIYDVQVVAPFMPEAHLARRLTNILQDEADRSCAGEGSLNWLMTQFFLSHYRLDQKDRKVMIREIYERTLKKGLDLDGQSIKEGAEKVFKNNLNQANRDSFGNSNLEDFNSFKDLNFEEVFQYVNVFPVLQFFDSKEVSESGQACSTGHMFISSHLRYFKKNPTDFINYVIDVLEKTRHPLATILRNHSSRFKELFKYNASPLAEDPKHPIAGLTLSFIKKPTQVLFYGLRAQFQAKPEFQVFSLNQSLEFKASAFAKPFGGRFGPDEGQQDPMIPIQTSLKDEIGNRLDSYILQPNYSRWPGDRWGLLDPQLHDNSYSNQFLTKFGGVASTTPFSYSMEDFFHLIFYETVDDPLARPPVNYASSQINPMHFMRLMELMAVYPDFYDLSYYSISANYMNTYFQRICRLLSGGGCRPGSSNRHQIQGVPYKVYVRGDFGWPDSDFYLRKNQDERQPPADLSIAPAFLQRPPVPRSPRLQEKGIVTKVLQKHQGQGRRVEDLTSRRIFYSWLAKDLPGQLLSSWSPTTKPDRYEKYNFPEQQFLKCRFPALKNKPVPNSCAVGGRSGYSVKLISCETVKSFDQSLQPPDIRDYCPP